jgi:hypothetical protein
MEILLPTPVRLPTSGCADRYSAGNRYLRLVSPPFGCSVSNMDGGRGPPVGKSPPGGSPGLRAMSNSLQLTSI